MTPSERGYKTQYEHLWQRYRNDVIDWEEEKARLMTMWRNEMLTNAQLHRELEQARELIDKFIKPVDNSKETVSK